MEREREGWWGRARRPQEEGAESGAMRSSRQRLLWKGGVIGEEEEGSDRYGERLGGRARYVRM